MVLGEPLQFHEMVVALLLFAGFIPITLQYRRHGTRWFFSAYLLFMAAGVLTVLESFYMTSVLNLLEHTTILLASILFWLTAYKSTFEVLGVDAHNLINEIEEGMTG